MAGSPEVDELWVAPHSLIREWEGDVAKEAVRPVRRWNVDHAQINRDISVTISSSNIDTRTRPNDEDFQFSFAGNSH